MLAPTSAETVRVICRFRPHREQLLRGGNAQGGTTDKKEGGNKRISHGPEKPSSKEVLGAGGSYNPATGYKLEYGPDGKTLAFTPPMAAGGVKGRPYTFTFDQIFDPTSTQTDAFNAIAKDTIADVLKGYNGSIFAYGQTGSGKTFTMFGGGAGNFKLRGVIPRTADELFAGIADSEELDEVTIKCSFLEIYLESIRDLLQPKNKGLKIRELPSGEVYVQGLSDEYVASSEDIMQLLSVGEKNRTVASTEMNEVSSRSHSVLIIVVNQKLKDGSVRVGKLNLADLAGSERIERTGATGVTLEQAKQINGSLSALGGCINALTDAKRTHIPFRDSVLTFLLKDSLGGNTKTTLLVACSPEENDCLETLSTLNFAKRAKKIKNSVSVNLKLGVPELTLMVAELKKELAIAHKTITALQKTILTMQAGGSIPSEMLDALLKPIQGGGMSTTGGGSKAAGQLAIEGFEHQLADAVATTTTTTTETSPTLNASISNNAIASTPPLQLMGDSSLLNATDGDDATLMGAPSTEDGLLSSAELNSSVPYALPALPGSGAGTPRHNDGLPSSGPVTPRRSDSLSMMSLPPSFADDDVPLLPPEDSSGGSTAQHSGASSPMNVPPKGGPLSSSSQIQASSSATESLLHEKDLALHQARDEISELRATLDALASETHRKEQEWLLEKEGLKNQVKPTPSPVASSTTIVPPTAAAAATTQAQRSTLDIDRIAALTAKNERLEKQMTEMKETWTAYLDLILENQKAQEKERRDAVDAEEREQAHQKNAKVVKPVRKKGFFSFFGSSKDEEATPKEGTNASSSTTTTQPATTSSSASAQSTPVKASPPLKPAVAPGSAGGASSSNSNAGSSTTQTASPAVPIVNSSSTPRSTATAATTTPQHNRAASASSSTTAAASTPVASPGGSSSVSRGTLDQCIRVGYLQKKPVGFSISKSWRKRLFVLRPNELEYYEVNTLPGSEKGDVVGSVPTSNSSLSSTPESSSSGSIGPGSLPTPSNLKQNFRGSIALDGQTTIVSVAYADAPYGFEVTTRDKHSKLCAATEHERAEWIKDLTAIISCKKRGIDPATLLQKPNEKSNGQDSPGFTLDPELLNHANFLLTNALAKIPASSPTPVILDAHSLQLAENVFDEPATAAGQ